MLTMGVDKYIETKESAVIPSDSANWCKWIDFY